MKTPVNCTSDVVVTTEVHSGLRMDDIRQQQKLYWFEISPEWPAIYWAVKGIRSKHCRSASAAAGKASLLHGRKYSVISLRFVS